MQTQWLFISLVGIILAANVSCTGEEKYISCPQISEYCSTHGKVLQGSPGVSHAHQIYKTGKAGPKGEKGDTGPLGPAITFDNDAFEKRILGKVKAMIENCRVFYNGSCFRLVGRAGNKYSKSDLQQKCSELGGRLANLYSEEHRLVVSRYARIELGVYVEIALGMTYNVETNRFRLTSGEWVDIEFTWHPGYPNKNTNTQNMFFSVQPDHASTSLGAFNYLLTYSVPHGLCEYEITV